MEGDSFPSVFSLRLLSFPNGRTFAYANESRKTRKPPAEEGNNKAKSTRKKPTNRKTNGLPAFVYLSERKIVSLPRMSIIILGMRKRRNKSTMKMKIEVEKLSKYKYVPRFSLSTRENGEIK